MSFKNETDYIFRVALKLAENQGSPSFVDPKRILIDEVFSGFRQGIPVFRVAEISEVPVDKSLISFMNQLTPSRNPLFRETNPIKAIHSTRHKLIPDYDLTYVQHASLPIEQTGLARSHRRDLAIKIQDVVDLFKIDTAKSKKKSSIVDKIITQTDRKTKQKIQELVGPSHQINNTFRVGNLQATEVIPDSRMDPLYCLRRTDSDGTLNSLFEAAFVFAMIGRITSLDKLLKQALTLGESAGKTGFNSIVGGDIWTLGELYFLSEIVTGKALIKGF